VPDKPSIDCPVPFSRYDRVVLAHGGGGRVMHRLIDGLFAAHLANPSLRTEHDGAVLDLSGPVAMTTDTFTVSPLFFPGGDIGRLAVCGTVNDVAMCGARPQYLSAAFTLEEGLLLADLERIVVSMAAAASEADVRIVTGDTKVVERGKGDGVFITTTGVGTVVAASAIGPHAVRPGDAVIVSGPVGDHGAAVLTVREGLEHESTIESDVAPVAAAILALIDGGIDLHCLRDPTRGGLASALCEIAASAELEIRLTESHVPVRDQVADACELFGLDPLYVACEGRFLAVVNGSHADRAVDILRRHGCPAAVTIGRAEARGPGRVLLESPLGTERVLDMLSGEQLPRIC
jgi:hydrogenase expression/formation protein HypE